MQNLIPALRVKHVTIFDLLDQEFYYGEFVFFPKLAQYLGRIVAISGTDAQEIGRISELVYLYAKIHTSAQEGTLEDEGFRSQVQMPVLLGDLFLGRFYRMLAECGKENCLPVYLNFMKEMNSRAVDRLDASLEENTEWITLLAQTVAEAIGILVGEGFTDCENLKVAAENYLREEWPKLYGSRIGSVSELETALQAEMF